MPEQNPTHIMEVGMGFFGSKTLLSAVELGLFTELAKQPMTANEIAQTLDLHPRAVPDFPDALVATQAVVRLREALEAIRQRAPGDEWIYDRLQQETFR